MLFNEKQLDSICESHGGDMQKLFFEYELYTNSYYEPIRKELKKKRTTVDEDQLYDLYQDYCDTYSVFNFLDSVVYYLKRHKINDIADYNEDFIIRG